MSDRSLMSPSPAADRADLRRKIEEVIHTDPEFEAFCLDYFPSTYRLFSAGMDRQQKLNCLLARENLQSIADLLLTRAVGNSKEKRRMARMSPVLSMIRQAARGLLCMGVGMGLAGLLWASYKHKQTDTRSSTEILRSTPPGADVWDMQTGRLLGTTPWQIEPRLLPVVVCLRRPGTDDVMVSLAAGEVPQRTVTLSPADPTHQEVCDVPIPIIQ